MKNREITDILNAFAAYLDMKNIPFKPRAYEKAALAIESLDEAIEDIYGRGGLKALELIPGVGMSIAKKIEEYLKTGTVKEFEKLEKKMPVKMRELLSIEGVGPRTIKILYEKLKIKDVASLKKAARAGRIRKLPHFGVRSEEKILKGIEFIEGASERTPIGEALPLARSLVARLRKVRGIKRIQFAGSLRRWQETIGDIDLLALSDKPKIAMEAFVSMPEVAYIHGQGPTKSSVRLRSGIDADLRVVPEASFGAALQYFTGNKDHNVLLRKIAIKHSYKLNEYGLFKGRKQVAGVTEESIYKALGIRMPIPELRQGGDELKKLWHNIIKLEDLKGDLQTQTKWTDGKNTIVEMAEAAKRLGHEYIAVTDHTRSLAMTSGADEEKLKRQMREIERLNKSLKGMSVLAGAEVNIMKDGTLDIRDDVLEELDVVGAAVHSHFNLPSEVQTQRIMRAMENPHVDIIFHPTGRIIGRRPPHPVNIDDLLKKAAETGTVMEIDAHPYRLDLKDEHISHGIELGIFFSIDSDAHHRGELTMLEYGVGQARRAGLERDMVINTFPLERLKEFLSVPKNLRYGKRKREKIKS